MGQGLVPGQPAEGEQGQGQGQRMELGLMELWADCGFLSPS